MVLGSFKANFLSLLLALLMGAPAGAVMSGETPLLKSIWVRHFTKRSGMLPVVGPIAISENRFAMIVKESQSDEVVSFFLQHYSMEGRLLLSTRLEGLPLSLDPQAVHVLNRNTFVVQGIQPNIYFVYASGTVMEKQLNFPRGAEGAVVLDGHRLAIATEDQVAIYTETGVRIAEVPGLRRDSTLVRTDSGFSVIHTDEIIRYTSEGVRIDSESRVPEGVLQVSTTQLMLKDGSSLAPCDATRVCRFDANWKLVWKVESVSKIAGLITLSNGKVLVYGRGFDVLDPVTGTSIFKDESEQSFKWVNSVQAKSDWVILQSHQAMSVYDVNLNTVVAKRVREWPLPALIKENGTMIEVIPTRLEFLMLPQPELPTQLPSQVGVPLPTVEPPIE